MIVAFCWLLASLVTADILYVVYRVGQPRPPITGGIAVGTVIQYGLVVVCLVYAAVHL